MAEERIKKAMPSERTHTGRALASAVEKTVKSWPQWKRDTYNNCFATASGSKKY